MAWHEKYKSSNTQKTKTKKRATREKQKTPPKSTTTPPQKKHKNTKKDEKTPIFFIALTRGKKPLKKQCFRTYVRKNNHMPGLAQISQKRTNLRPAHGIGGLRYHPKRHRPRRWCCARPKSTGNKAPKEPPSRRGGERENANDGKAPGTGTPPRRNRPAPALRTPSDTPRRPHWQHWTNAGRRVQ